MGNVKKTILSSHKGVFCLQLLFIVSSLFCLTNTDALSNVYIFCAVGAILSLAHNQFMHIPAFSKRKETIYSTVAIIISVCIVCANYNYLMNFSGIAQSLGTCVKILIVFIGSMCAGWNILLMVDCICNKQKSNCDNQYQFSLKQTVFISFSFIVFVDIIYLFVFEYPGHLTPDSISQMSQILSNNYSNHHPFYHTMLIKACVCLGISLFKDINAAVACYSVFQIIFMATCFTFCVATMYQMKIPKLWIILTICFFTLMPYHIAYSITMWKDIPFGGAVLLQITALFRLMKKIGKYQWINCVFFIIGSLGTCLWRSNGWIAFAILSIFFIICFFKEYKKISITFIVVLVFTYIMIHPVLGRLGVNQPDTIESLSIPAQQIARVVTDGGNISQDEYDLLDQIIDTSKIPETYISYISDPIKELVRKRGNQSLLNEHKIEYLRLWISIGLKNPTKYLEAWVDQTKGYWNGGYRYWIMSNGVYENKLGVHKRENNAFEKIHSIQLSAFSWFNNDGLFDVFRSIGLCMWVVLGLGCVNLANKREKQAFLSVLPLSIIVTLCIATPVYCEFRYAYALFTCIPLIICVTLQREEGDNNG